MIPCLKLYIILYSFSVLSSINIPFRGIILLVLILNNFSFLLIKYIIVNTKYKLLIFTTLTFKMFYLIKYKIL